MIDRERAHKWRPAELVSTCADRHSLSTATFRHTFIRFSPNFIMSLCSCCASLASRTRARAATPANTNATKHRQLLTWESADESRERIEHIKHHTPDHVSQEQTLFISLNVNSMTTNAGGVTSLPTGECCVMLLFKKEKLSLNVF